jgi:hypothetical protein
MKKYISIAVAFLIGVITLNAQNAPHAVVSQDKQVTRLMAELQQACQLTPEQATKVQPIVQSFVNTRAANRQQYGSDKTSLHTANQSNMKNFKASLSTVLSADQMNAYEQYKKQRKGMKRGGESGGMDEGSGQQ